MVLPLESTNMTDIKESHALISCPHCGKQIRVRARTPSGQLVKETLERRDHSNVFDKLNTIFDELFGPLKRKK